ncbi:MAG: Trm112 family protein [Ilumatobacter sp.]|uniref:Trm112 family protein n=1 Tax=Ilumatobacter sp. TaxID=1967498 RepID=UPI00260E9022|nr:Trm112 family protein [Ilumatobacter sp.]MDJ0770512.1 Trm112 family protein [Ilumatobacter sp.]
MRLAPALLAILACPDDKGPLFYIESESVLFNPRLRRTYDVRDGIPVMLIEESNALDDAEFERLNGLVAEQRIAPTFETGT